MNPISAKRKRKEEAGRIIRHYRLEAFDQEALGLVGKRDFERLMKISGHSVLGRMTAIEAAFCLGYRSGRKQFGERIARHFGKGGAE